jgi:hypothetical protein
MTSSYASPFGESRARVKCIAVVGDLEKGETVLFISGSRGGA